MRITNSIGNSAEPTVSFTRIKSIDGLRAVAILAVLIFHIDESYLPGGYLGVDLFFIISGFVVTRSLMRKQSSYARFLAARFYRLAPAAAATILTTLAAFQFTGAGLLGPTHSVSALGATIALSNVYFMFQDSYFDGALQSNPFLHFWSLSVEEQFYFVWPFFVAPFVRSPLAIKIIVVCGLTIFSLVAFEFSPAQAFFFMPARAFQFACGAGAYLVFRRYPLQLPPVLLYTTIIVCAVPFFYLNGTQHWLFNTLAPTVLFSVLVYLARASHDALILRILPIQLIGSATYSIYLVHWPIIVYLYIINPRSLETQSMAFFASFAVGFALHYLVERPCNSLPLPKNRRRKEKRPGNLLRFAGPALTITTLTFGGFLTALASPPRVSEDRTELTPSANSSLEKMLSSRMVGPSEETAKLMSEVADGRNSVEVIEAVTPSSATSLKADPSAKRPNMDLLLAYPQGVYATTEDERQLAAENAVVCTTFETGRIQGQASAKLLADINLNRCLSVRSILFADSTWEAATRFLATELKSADFAQLNSAGCIFVLFDTMPDCNKINALRADILKGGEYAYDTIFLAFNWGSYRREFGPLIELMAASKANVVILTPLPEFGSSPDQIMAANSSPEADMTPWLVDRVSDAQAALTAAAETNDNIELLRWSALDASAPKLPAVTTAGNRIYRDDYHNTPEGIEWLIMSYLERKQAAIALGSIAK